MRETFLCALGACCVASSAFATPVNVILTLDQWQSPYPYRWVTQTQKDGFFTAADEYCGFFSGLVTVGDASSQRYVFFCTEMNQNINIGQMYTSFTMYSPNEYLDTPFCTGRPAAGGDLLDTEQKAYDRGVFRYLGIQDVAGFVSTEAQDLTGFLVTDATLAIMNKITSEQAALAQMSIWEMTHEQFDPAHPTAGIDLHAGLVQWEWQGGTAFETAVQTDFVKTVSGGLANNPEPGIVGVLSCGGISLLSLRNRKRRMIPWSSN